ncbi:hypothetical protein ACLQ2N_32460 [Streptomyces sp. DT224]|uniref:hypothetical protein n=1 Tax=Streptomyces sp. DT224 TaxID=3393426 RepID=UPI003CF4DCC3
MTAESEAPTSTRMVITCHTAGCPSEGIQYVAAMYPNAEAPVWSAMCAGCEQLVNDIVPAA